MNRRQNERKGKLVWALLSCEGEKAPLGIKHLKHLILLCLFVITGISASAYSFSASYSGKIIYYNITDATKKTVAVTYRDTGYNSYSGSVAIPSTVTHSGTTYSVTSIGESAFSDCSGLTSITIPNSVTSIEGEAFYDCYRLTSVTIGNSVESIGNSAFACCSGLTSITIPNSVTSIGVCAFHYCSGLTSISVESGNQNYDSRENCNAIIETVTNTLIAGCNNTAIPNSVTGIGYYAFTDCSGLTSITIPNSVTSIGESAFYGCSGLTSITIPNSVTSIGDNAFNGCSGLSAVNITNLESWCNISFNYSNPLEYAHHLYLNNEEITDLVIPNSVTSIGNYAFRGCYGLTSVTIPNSVTSIGVVAFSDCSGLTSVTIPNSVTSIGDWAFSGCTGLTSVTNLATTPQSISYYTFFSTYGTLQVSYGCKAAYEAANYWKNFTIVEGNWVQSVSLDEASVTLFVDETKTFNATVLPDDADIKTVSWSSSDENVATVNDGEVTAVGAGTATITATTTDGTGISASCQITVLQNEFVVNDLTYRITNPENLTVEVKNGSTASGAIVIPETVTYAGVDFNVISIAEKAFYNNTAITSIDIPASVTNIGKNAFFAVSSAINEVRVHWMNPSDCTCGTALFAPTTKNNAQLYVPAGTVSLYQAITNWNFAHISRPPVLVESISLNKNVMKLGVDETETLTATILPDNADNQTLEWNSSDTDVATVNSEGLVTALGTGTATITATTTDGTELSASCSVTVVKYISSITLDYDTLRLSLGDPDVTLHATIDPSDATTKTLSWSSSNTGVVTVNNGVVHAVTNGYATVRAEATDDSGKFAECLVIVPETAGTNIVVDGINYTITNNSDNPSVVVCDNSEIDIDHVVIPEEIEYNKQRFAVTGIVELAFLSNSNIQTLEIPASVTTIGDMAFYDMSNLTDVTNYATTPQQIDEYAFDPYGTLHVYACSRDAYENADNWNNFTIVDLTESVSITSAGSGTYASKHALDFSSFEEDEIGAYYCSGLNNSGKVVMRPIESLVPANTGIYISGEPGTYEVPLAPSAEEIDDDNYLVGNTSGALFTIYQTDGDMTNYILQKKSGDEHPRFYKVSSQGNNVGNHRAYLQLPTNVDAKEILDIADEATDINNVDIANAKANANGIFDLSGRKVGDDYKGIVIVNGRKVLVK